ncbi:hypothetical protein ROK90_04810 [Cronobacter dublinensis]|uniref:hypothetical protein n=1 Tax=Cronobacter dublinensis TaxID=413497 RepID=UPI0023DD5AFC|nr:hypothetical protein [Cronobacter dublinensis]MDT3665336.1 hypothetical protein [Cronobacter dublinensis]WEP47304.1 hypothetical protein NNQ27_10555 [Cronobacter dublinensis]
MSLKKIVLTNEYRTSAQTGGGAWLDRIEDWPTDSKTGLPMLPLLTLFADFFPGKQLSEDQCITVFIPQTEKDYSRTYCRNISCNLADQTQGYNTRVIVHKKSNAEHSPLDINLLPKGYVDLVEMDDDELDEEIEDEINGSSLSKQFGRPHWLQDPVNIPPQYFFGLQLNEADLLNFGDRYAGMFDDGMGYLFIDYRVKKASSTADAGLFFIQFL